MNKNIFLISISTLALAACSSNGATSGSSAASSSNIYQQSYAAATAIYNQMTFEEKIGQLILPSYVLLNDSVESGSANCSAALAANESEAIIAACGLDQIAKYHIGAVLTGGGPYYDAPTAANWARLNSLATQVHNTSNPLDPLLLTGNDAIHINMHVQGAVMGPHDIGLGATHDPELLQEIAKLSALDSLYTGFNWIYMPTVAVVQDTRWGRSYEGFGADPALVKKMAEPYINGLQNVQNAKIIGTLATAKHFIGDGATLYGFDESGDAYLGSEQAFWDINGQGYEGAANANVGSIMVSYNYINTTNTFMHLGGDWDILNAFKQDGVTGSDGKTYQFPGFAVSDWNGSMRAAYFYATGMANIPLLALPQIVAKSINGGVDMLMVAQGSLINPWNNDSGYNFTSVGQVFAAAAEAVNSGLISPERLQDAVVRILAVKLAMKPQAADSINYSDVQAQERKLAAKAAEESLILLKNTKSLLPVNQSTVQTVVFIGETNNIGFQNGGWTINWQGQETNEFFLGADKVSSGAATIEDGIKLALAGQAVDYINIPANGSISSATLKQLARLDPSSTLVVAMVAEYPYAEMMGDVGNSHAADGWYDYGQANTYNLYSPTPQSQFMGLTFSSAQSSAIQALKSNGVKILTVVFSGRPVVLSEDQNGSPINAPLPNSDALIAAFLPGTTGGTAIARAVFGQYRFGSGANGQSNKLTFPWPANMQQVETKFATGSLFPVGYGLSD